MLQKFRKHEINILVSTNIVEEGVDIPACNMIIRFSKIHNFGSYIQSKVGKHFIKNIVSGKKNLILTRQIKGAC